MFDLGQICWCFLVTLYLLFSLVHDVFLYETIVYKKDAELRREETTRKKTCAKLDMLIELMEKEHLENDNKERLIELRDRLKKK